MTHYNPTNADVAAKVAAKVALWMGSQSDWPTMRYAVEILEEFGIPADVAIISAHRTPDRMAMAAKAAKDNGIQVIIAGAGGAAHLPGMVAAYTTLPVLGVPVESHALKGMDSLLSIVQMPAGVPVATFAIGKAGAANAALMAVSILSLNAPDLAEKLSEWRQKRTDDVAEIPNRKAV